MSKLDELRINRLAAKGQLGYWKAYHMFEAQNWISKWYSQVRIDKIEKQISKLDKQINKLK